MFKGGCVVCVWQTGRYAPIAAGLGDVPWVSGCRRTKPVWHVLIVEDDPQMREFFAASVLRSERLALVASVGSVAEARKCWRCRGRRWT